MSSLLSYHIFSFFISNIFENFKFGRNFSKFTAGMDCRLVAVSVKIGGNRRLPIGKENTGSHSQVICVLGSFEGVATVTPILLVSTGLLPTFRENATLTSIAKSQIILNLNKFV